MRVPYHRCACLIHWTWISHFFFPFLSPDQQAVPRDPVQQPHHRQLHHADGLPPAPVRRPRHAQPLRHHHRQPRGRSDWRRWRLRRLLLLVHFRRVRARRQAHLLRGRGQERCQSYGHALVFCRNVGAPDAAMVRDAVYKVLLDGKVNQNLLFTAICVLSAQQKVNCTLVDF